MPAVCECDNAGTGCVTQLPVTGCRLKVEPAVNDAALSTQQCSVMRAQISCTLPQGSLYAARAEAFKHARRPQTSDPCQLMLLGASTHIRYMPLALCDVGTADLLPAKFSEMFCS